MYRKSLFHAVAIVPLALAMTLWFAAPSHAGRFIDTPVGPIYVFTEGSTLGQDGTPPSADGDTYDFQHQLGALIDGVFQCFSEHMSGTGDNTVLFDGLSELLDPYVNGTEPFVFEFETQNGDGTTDAFFNSFSDGGEDLFPEGFEDPATGTPLDAACIEIGREDLLDFDQPVTVTNAMFEASGDNGTIIPPIDITGAFSDPWDGRLSIVFPGRTGSGINGMILDISVEPAPFDPQPIFADGFESGDASSWTDQVP